LLLRLTLDVVSEEAGIRTLALLPFPAFQLRLRRYLETGSGTARDQFPYDFSAFRLIIYLHPKRCVRILRPAKVTFETMRRMTMDWKKHGVKIVHAGELDANTPRPPGMTRAAAITYARMGASKLWAGTVVVSPTPKLARTIMASWRR
jgi:hypothetical protein